jgi:N-acetylglucosamine-6-sulfatase
VDGDEGSGRPRRALTRARAAPARAADFVPLSHVFCRSASAIAIAIGLVAAVAACGDGEREAGRERPNFVVVMTDDQALDTMRAMPFTRRALGGKGVVFEHAIASFPLCCPSRASFLTGQYAHNHGVLDNHPPKGGYARLDRRRILPVWLRRDGYETGFVGKYLNGYGKPKLGGETAVPPGWTDWYALPPKGDKRSYEYDLNENGDLVRYGSGEANYKTDVLARRAADFIRTASERSRPFFLWVATPAPHTDKQLPPSAPRNPEPAPRHRGRFAGVRAPRPPSFDEADVADKPRNVRRLPRLDSDRRRALDRTYVSQLETLLAVDDLVHRLVAALRRSGELGRTLVAFTSDNGYLRGQHRIDSGKSRMYEEAIGVPLLIRGPGFPTGRRVSEPVANIDLAPTILDLAGVDPPIEPDGRSLVSSARGTAPPRGVLLEVFERRADQFVGLRTTRYAYAEREHDRDELYDLRSDPHQLVNVAADPEYADARARLRARVAELRRCAAAECG